MSVRLHGAAPAVAAFETWEFGMPRRLATALTSVLATLLVGTAAVVAIPAAALADSWTAQVNGATEGLAATRIPLTATTNIPDPAYEWEVEVECIAAENGTAEYAVQCPGSASGPVLVTLRVSGSAGEVATATHTIQLTPVPEPTVTFDHPERVSVGVPFRVDATVTANPPGRGPFSYYWFSLTGGCELKDWREYAVVTCDGSVAGGTADLVLSVEQADGQRADAYLSIPVDAAAARASWTVRRAAYPTLVTGRLSDAQGRAVADAPVEVEVRWAGTARWRTVARGLRTDGAGAVSYAREVSRAGRVRLVFPGDGTLAPAVSRPVAVKVPTRLTVRRVDHRGRATLTGLLRAVDGRPVAGTRVVVRAKRDAGQVSRWKRLTQVRTDRAGRLTVRVPGGRQVTYRLVFPGSATLAATSRTVRGR
jgi:hypothetical protein